LGYSGYSGYCMGSTTWARARGGDVSCRLGCLPRQRALPTAALWAAPPAGCGSAPFHSVAPRERRTGLLRAALRVDRAPPAVCVHLSASACRRGGA
jgi:hypothetical protein